MRARARGFSLLEVLVSMTIFSIGVLGTLGLYGRSVTGFSDAKYRTDAAMLADAIINDMWVNRANLSSYVYTGTGTNTTLQPWLTAVSSTLPSGKATIAVAGAAATGATVTVTVTWQPPNATGQGVTHTHTEIATVQNP